MRIKRHCPVWVALAALLLPLPLQAQQGVPLLRPEEKSALDRQTEEFNRLITPSLRDAALSTVRVWDSQRLRPGNYIAYGTVIGDGHLVLTKWSESLSARSGRLLVQSADGTAVPAAIYRVHPEEDLAVLQIEGDPLTPVKWSDAKPVLGSFMAAPQPDGQLAGFGVLSVHERSLRESDQAFLGVVGDLGFDGPGVKVREVSEDSGAARAGVRVGDIILRVGDRRISGLMELRTTLTPIEPGETVTLTLERDGKTLEVDALLGSRPEFPNYLGRRLQQMERMGTEVSRIRDSFSSVIQTDMRLQPNQIGGPVVNLQGEVIGITVARADRTRSFVMSSQSVRELIGKPGKDPDLALAEWREARSRAAAQAPARPGRGEAPQATPQQLENHLRQMRRLMRLMERELEQLER